MLNRSAVQLALVAALKLGVSLALLQTGFHAISDDDYSRVTIAQAFSVSPSLDPSGTSWLPLPFWVYGGAMKAFGVELAKAQAVAVFLGVCAAVGVWALTRWLAFSLPAMTVAVLFGACIPHAAYYGAAVVPDYPTAVLTLVACVTLTTQSGRTRAFGGLCAWAATLSRYETWPVAFVVTAYALFDWVRWARKRRAHPSETDTLNESPRWLLATALLASSGVLAWLLHGVVRHGDALFFLKRVAAYRRALHEPALPLIARLLKEPLLLVRGEPELVLFVACSLAAWLVFERRADVPRVKWLRPGLALLGLVLFLTVGDILDGAPTHHEERVLLPIWLGLALAAGALTDRILRLLRSLPASARSQRFRVKCALFGALSSIPLVGYWLKPLVTQDEPFVDRSSAIAIAQRAAEVVPRGARVAIYTSDYGYFAAQAAFARPPDAIPLSRHDPRSRELDPLSSPEALSARLDALGARYLIVPATARTKTAELRLVLVEAGFALLAR